MADLTDAQLVLLSAASQRPDGALLPAPKDFKKNAATIARVLRSLIKRGLVAEQPTKATGAAVWREDKDGRRYALNLTKEGRDAIRVEDEPSKPASKQLAPPPAKHGKADPADPKKGSKLDRLAELLRRKGGATIQEAMKLTGWQAHSIRGAISGALKKKLGLAVASETVEGRGRVYRIAGRG